jgi:RHS repeat-associated protein
MNLTGSGYNGSPQPLTWDADSRLVGLGSGGPSGGSMDLYGYDVANHRVWHRNWLSDAFYFYGVDGKRIGTYYWDGTDTQLSLDTNNGPDIYFRGRLQGPAQDQVGSVGGGGSYPYGESYSPPVNNSDTVGFATYVGDATGLDYAWNRYYSSTLGRFLSSDPYKANNGGPGDPKNPQSWNRYAYVQNDPVNAGDPSGQYLIWCFDPGADSIYDGSCTGDDGDWDDASGLFSGTPNGPSMWWTVRNALVKQLMQAAIAALATNLARGGNGPNSSPVPASLVMESECWLPGAHEASTLAYTLEITYQIVDAAGQPMSAASLAGISISERFWMVSGSTGVQNGPGTWTIYNNGIHPDGTFTDYLSAGGIPGLAVRSGSALQGFTATGFLSNGLPLVSQPLMVKGFGLPTPVLHDIYGPNNVTVNGLGLGTNPATECH